VNDSGASGFEDDSQGVVDRIPVVLLTGFLGSGKTTLVRSLLRSQPMAETAVVVNEYGAVGLDHTLMWRAGEVVEVVENGCICCGISEDLLGVMEELFFLRLQRKIPRFRRVVIETTGLADPRPIVQALRSHPLVNERYRLARVICTVDAEDKHENILASREALAQVTSADLLFLTKSDLVDQRAIEAWTAKVQDLNPAAAVVSVRSDAFPDNLAEYFTRGVSAQRPAAFVGKAAHASIQTQTIQLPHTLAEYALFTALQELTETLGDRLLRLKGIVQLEGRASPAVVQAVRSKVFPLEDAPGFKGPGFIVLILQGTQEELARAASQLQALPEAGTS
jgi:G3E family GTPase